jgi:SSS family solute:Na+ symporter
MGDTSFTAYTGLLALAANIIVAVVINAALPGKAVARA